MALALNPLLGNEYSIYLRKVLASQRGRRVASELN